MMSPSLATPSRCTCSETSFRRSVNSVRGNSPAASAPSRSSHSRNLKSSSPRCRCLSSRSSHNGPPIFANCSSASLTPAFAACRGFSTAARSWTRRAISCCFSARANSRRSVSASSGDLRTRLAMPRLQHGRVGDEPFRQVEPQQRLDRHPQRLGTGLVIRQKADFLGVEEAELPDAEGDQLFDHRVPVVRQPPVDCAIFTHLDLFTNPLADHRPRPGHLVQVLLPFGSKAKRQVAPPPLRRDRHRGGSTPAERRRTVCRRVSSSGPGCHTARAGPHRAGSSCRRH